METEQQTEQQNEQKKKRKIWWNRTFTPQKSQPTPMWTFESGSDHQSLFSPLLPLSNEPERKPRSN